MYIYIEREKERKKGRVVRERQRLLILRAVRVQMKPGCRNSNCSLKICAVKAHKRISGGQ